MSFTGNVLRDATVVLPRPWGIVAQTLVRDLKGLPAILARSGPLELRLATTKKEIRKAQRLRYKVFYEESGAVPTPTQRLRRRDTCAFDRLADHLLVLDTSPDEDGEDRAGKVVGTYRLLRGDVAAASRSGFYSHAEFDLDPLLHRHRGKRFLELGRSCVHARYRSKRVIDLLWRGIGIYVAHHGIDALIGCASLPGTDPQELALPLAYAYHHASAPAAWQVAAAPGRGVRMDWLKSESVDPRRTFALLPPLMKAYVRAGSTFASEAVVDRQFGTTDLFTVLPLESADPRYLAHFS